MRVMALDQAATFCGFVLFDTDGQHMDRSGKDQPGILLDSGVISSSEKNDIKRTLDLATRIKAKLLETKAEKLVIEGHTYATMPTLDTTERLATITFLCRYVAQEIGLKEPERIFTGTMKSISGGHGKADKKEVRLGTCHFWGLDSSKYRDDNETDALAIGQAFLLKGSIKSGKRKSKENLLLKL